MPEPDPMAKWTLPPDWGTARIARAGLTIAPVAGLHLTRLGGDLEAAFAALTPRPASIGLWEIADAEAVAIRIGRDRALLVATKPCPLAPGWRNGFAVSDASDGYVTLSLAGEGLRALVAEATAADIDAGSPSAAILFAGVPALLYRTGATEARLHVEAPLAPYVWRWLETR